MHRYLLGLSLLLSTLCQLFHLPLGAGSNLPKLWKSDPADKPDGFYRFFYRLEVPNYSNPGKYKSFLIEEWAHLREARLRLDIQVQPEGIRRTILYYGDTNEIFFYEPFTCQTVTELDQALYPELVGIFPENGGFYLKFGIGSLWRYIERLNLDTYGETVPKKSDFLPLEYDSSKTTKFTYSTTSEFKYDVSLFMSDPSNVNTLSLIWIGGSKYALRIMDTPNELRQPRDQIEKVFQLPPGYGCARANTVQEVFPIPMEFMGLNASELRLVRLDMVASRRIEGSDQGRGNYDGPDRWRSHSSSVRILSGGYRAPSGDYERNYMVFEKEESNSDSDSVAKYLAGIASSRRTSVQRTKVVWDMSSLGSDSRSRYYELDASGGKCLGYGETKSPLDVGIEMRVAPASSDFESDSPPLTLTLGIELLATLFSPDGFHLIARNHRLPDKEELVFEKRDASFKIKNKQGQVVWEGPVSLVRQFVMARGQQPSGNGAQPRTERDMITMNFYSKKLDKILARVKLLVAELRTIDQHYLLDEIDISTCLIRLGSGGILDANQVDELSSGQQLDENLNFEMEYYALDDDVYAKFVTDQRKDVIRRQIELEFIRSLIELSDYRLDLMQIINLDVDMRSLEVEGADPSPVKVTGQLLDRPSLLNFVREPGQRFMDGGQIEKLSSGGSGGGGSSQQIRSLLKESARSCAASCDHFNCTMFSYCAGPNLCDLLLSSDKGSAGVKVTWDPNCVLFTRHDLARSIVSPHELIHQISQTIRTQQEQPTTTLSNTKSSPLVLELDADSPGTILLVPESIESSLLHSQEFEELSELEDGSSRVQNMLIAAAAGPRTGLRQEYTILVQDKKYKDINNDRLIFPLVEASHMTYHDCESLCKQNDCLSFSYCRLEKSCQISSLHRREQIESKIEQDSGCVLMTRDYLSKFQKVSQKPMRPRKTFETLRVDSLSECATVCMEQDPPKCRSFYYCPSDENRASCHLKSNNILADTSELLPPTPSPIDNISNPSCDLYARSHLSDFDKFYGKSLPFPDAKTTASIHRGLEAEPCASECADKAGECIGFQVCTMSGSNLGDFVCTTFSAGLGSSVASRLESNSDCTFFLTSPGSELYQLASDKLIEMMESAKAIAAKESEAKARLAEAARQRSSGKLSALSVWLLRILFISIGLLCGYGVIYGSRQSPLMRTTLRRISRRLPGIF